MIRSIWWVDRSGMPSASKIAMVPDSSSRRRGRSWRNSSASASSRPDPISVGWLVTAANMSACACIRLRNRTARESSSFATNASYRATMFRSRATTTKAWSCIIGTNACRMLRPQSRRARGAEPTFSEAIAINLRPEVQGQGRDRPGTRQHRGRLRRRSDQRRSIVLQPEGSLVSPITNALVRCHRLGIAR